MFSGKPVRIGIDLVIYNYWQRRGATAAAATGVVASALLSACAETAFSTSFLTVSRKAPCSHSRQTDVSMSIACRRP